MNKLLVLVLFVFALSVSVFMFPDGAVAVLAGSAFAALIILGLRRVSEQHEFLVQIFLIALLARWLFAALIIGFDIWRFFGVDSIGYDKLGWAFAQSWSQGVFSNLTANQMMAETNLSVWSMSMLIGGIYYLLGHNMLAAQFIVAIFGAATAPLVYFCAQQVFYNQKVSRLAAIIVALFPSQIVWSGQILRDGPIIFLLVLSMTLALKLQEKLDYRLIALLLTSLAGIFVLRSYIFFILASAIVGSFVVDTKSMRTLVQRVSLLVVVGLALTYFGFLRTAENQLSEFTNLERIQVARGAMATEAGSGFGEDLDVSTSEGAISALPIGLSYLMLSPFPWEIENFRQALTLPEMIVWWSFLPLIVIGLWYSLRYKLKRSIGILLFILMLSLGYSVLQGNVGTTYRHRAQLQVFYFMFVAAGVVLLQEKRKNSQVPKFPRGQNRRMP